MNPVCAVPIPSNANIPKHAAPIPHDVPRNLPPMTSQPMSITAKIPSKDSQASNSTNKVAVAKRAPENREVAKSPDRSITKERESPADIFLKETRRVIPNARARRNSNRQNQTRPGSQSSGTSFRTTKSAPSANPYSVPLENMFSPLESQVDGGRRSRKCENR